MSELLQGKIEKDNEEGEIKKIAQMKRRRCLPYLFSSNLLALCFSRLRIQMSRDTPDNDAAPPAAKPDATATAGVEEAGEKQKTRSIVSFALLTYTTRRQYPSAW